MSDIGAHAAKTGHAGQRRHRRSGCRGRRRPRDPVARRRSRDGRQERRPAARRRGAWRDEVGAAAARLRRDAEHARSRSAGGHRPSARDEDRREAARRIVALGAAHVLIKGGHAAGRRRSCDLLYDGHRVPRVPRPNVCRAAIPTAPAARLRRPSPRIWRSAARCRKPFRSRSSTWPARSGTRPISAAGTGRWTISGRRTPIGRS